LLNVLIEVRQDLVATEAAAAAWGDRLAGVAAEALRSPNAA